MFLSFVELREDEDEEEDEEEEDEEEETFPLTLLTML